MTFEVPTGNSDVFQGEGDGLVNLLVSGVKLVDDWQFAGGLGFQIPFSDQQSTQGWMSAHVSYEVCKWFIPLVEVNWFHVLDRGRRHRQLPVAGRRIGARRDRVRRSATSSTSVPTTPTKTAILFPPRSVSARASPTASMSVPLTKSR